MATKITNASFTVSLLGNLSSDTPTPLSSAGVIQQPSLVALQFVTGVAQALGLNQAGFLSGTLAAAANTTINLYTMAGGNDAAGNAFTLAKCKLFIVLNLGATAGTPLEADTLIVGNAASTAWAGVLNSTGTVTLPGTAALNSGLGGFAIFGAPGSAGFTVPSGGGNNTIKLLSGAAANTITYNIWALGSTS